MGSGQLGYIQYRRLLYAGHLFRAEADPTVAKPEDEPHTLFRLLLTHVKHEGQIWRRYGIPGWVPMTSRAGGANPHAVDFKLNMETTYRPGSIAEFRPKYRTYGELHDAMRPKGSRDERSKHWKKIARDLILSRHPQFALPRKEKH
jgi:hypothetical protein